MITTVRISNYIVRVSVCIASLNYLQHNIRVYLLVYKISRLYFLIKIPETACISFFYYVTTPETAQAAAETAHENMFVLLSP